MAMKSATWDSIRGSAWAAATMAVEVVALPAAYRFGVEGEVVLDPREDPRGAPSTERSCDGGGVDAGVEQLQECADLHAGHGEPSARRGRRGRDCVTDGDQTGPTELPPVDVEQPTTDDDAAVRRGDAGVGPCGQPRDRPAGGIEGIRVTEGAQAGVGG